MKKLLICVALLLPMVSHAVRPLPDKNPYSKTNAEVFDCHIVVTTHVHKFGSPLTEGLVSSKVFLNKRRHGPLSLQMNRDGGQFYITAGNEKTRGLVSIQSSHESALAAITELTKKMYIDAQCP